LLEADTELKDWWARERAFDEKIAERIANVSPPVDLRARILAEKPPPAGE
jgi:hypothetical protein